MQAAAVILAAGSSTRFGSPKQLARIGGVTMLERVIGIAGDAGLDPIIAVVPPGLGVPDHVVVVVNGKPADGLSRSLRLGLQAVSADVETAVILLGDQPTVAVDTLGALLAEASSTDRPVVAAHADGHIGPPVVLTRAAFGLADQVTGDEGLRGVLERHSDLVAMVEVGAHAPDVDTPSDLDALPEKRA